MWRKLLIAHIRRLVFRNWKCELTEHPSLKLSASFGNEIRLNMRFHFKPQVNKPFSQLIYFYFDDCWDIVVGLSQINACCRELIISWNRSASMTTKELRVGYRVRAPSQPLEVRVCGLYSILSWVSVWARSFCWLNLVLNTSIRPQVNLRRVSKRFALPIFFRRVGVGCT